MAKGWIRLNRKILDNRLWEDKPFTKGQAWIDLLLLAEWCDGRQVLCGNEAVTLKKGQLFTSLQKLSDRWGWTRSKVLRFLTRLETETMVNINRNTNRNTSGTLVTIENYAKYQDVGNTNRNTSGTEAEHERNSSETPTYLYNKGTIKQVTNIASGRAQFFPPSVDEVRAYCEEKGLAVDAEVFVDFYASKGWRVGNEPMIDWQATVRNWHRRDGGGSPEQAEKGRKEQEEREAALEAEWAREFEDKANRSGVRTLKDILQSTGEARPSDFLREK